MIDFVSWLAGHTTIHNWKRLTMRTATIAILFILASGCATVPQSHIFDNNRSYDASMDDVWPEVIEFFAEANIPVSTLERNSGLIASDNLRLGLAEFNSYADCGRNQFATVVQSQSDLNVFVREQSEDSTTVTVNTNFQAVLENLFFRGFAQCVSTGNLEDAVLDRISTGLNLPAADF